MKVVKEVHLDPEGIDFDAYYTFEEHDATNGKVIQYVDCRGELRDGVAVFDLLKAGSTMTWDDHSSGAAFKRAGVE